MSAERPTEQVMVRLTPSMRAAVEEDAERNERTISQTVRLALRRYLMEPPARCGDYALPVRPVTAADLIPESE